MTITIHKKDIDQRRPVEIDNDSKPNTNLQSLEPFNNRILLYIMHFCFAFVSRMWDMGIVLLVAELTNNSLFIVALTGLLTSMSIFFFMSHIGRWLDKTNRLLAVKYALTIKIVTITIAYIICSILSSNSNYNESDLQDTTNASATLDNTDNTNNIHHMNSKHKFPILVYSLPILAAIVGMSFCAITQSIEKDWIVVLSNKDSNWLSSTNSVMTQIDLGCSSAAPAITGFLFSSISQSWVSIILLFINALTSLALYNFMSYLYQEWPALGQKLGVDILDACRNLNEIELNENNSIDDEINLSCDSYDENTLDSSTKRSSLVKRVSIDAKEINHGDVTDSENTCDICWICTQFPSYIKREFKDFLESGCVGAMISYAALYLTVLSFGSLMTVYTRWAGVSDGWIGLFRGLSALFGYTGALIFPVCSKTWGLYKSAQIAITYQFILVFIAASSFFWTISKISVYIVIIAVLFSRTGLWLFDLCARQIAQETILETVRGKVNGQWRSITAFFEMSAYLIAVFISEPEDFWILTTVSASMIGFALIVFTATNPDPLVCSSTSNVLNTTTTTTNNNSIINNSSDRNKNSNNIKTYGKYQQVDNESKHGDCLNENYDDNDEIELVNIKK